MFCFGGGTIAFIKNTLFLLVLLLQHPANHYTSKYLPKRLPQNQSILN